MRNIIIGALAALTLVGGSSCATVQKTKPLTAEESICAAANEYVEGAEKAANAEGASGENVLEVAVESCGLVASTGMGYATYHINGYTKAEGRFLGHMKRMIIFANRDNKWVMVDEGTIAFLPPLDSAPVTRPGLDL
jgi:hypothetical protein